MKITHSILDDAVAEGILTAEQAERLVAFVARHPRGGPSFDFTHVLYYLGGLIAIGAMTLFMNLGWEAFGGWGIFFICLLYAGVGLKLSAWFATRGHVIPAGLCATFVVALTPLALYGLQQGMGYWPDASVYREYHRYIHWHWLYLELGTLAVGTMVAWRFKYPFLVFPIAVTLWYMTMDIAAMITGGDFDWELRKLVSMYMGLLIIGLAFWVDLRARNQADYAFWLYIVGVVAFWGGLTLQNSDSEWSKFLYFCTNLVMLGIGVMLVRRVFVVFGGIGSCIYLGHLAHNVFADSWLFPISLTAIGLAIIFLGVLWQKHEKALTARVRAWLPQPLRELLESKH